METKLRVDPLFLNRQVAQTKARISRAIQNPMIVVMAPPDVAVHFDFETNPIAPKPLPAIVVNGEPMDEMLYVIGETFDNMHSELEFLRAQVVELTRTNESLTRSNARWKHREDTAKERIREALNQAVDNL